MKEQMDKIIQLVKDNPNDMELGRKVREEINNFSKQLKSLTESSNSNISLKRIPHFCSRCRHNSSTRIP